ncbi:MAG: hypothetical protein OXU70_13880 [Gammaproteobacteria bacterium]|nr:hypothetical protein [Gammaproteobacteria bacterium]
MNKLASSPRLYTVNGMMVGAALGSLVAPIYMAAHNYAALGKPELAKRIVRSGLIVYGVILAASLLLPQTITWAPLFIVAQVAIAGFLGNRLQGPAIEYHQSNGGEAYGLGQAVLVALLAGLALMFILLVIALPLSLTMQSLGG